jgi:predicted amidophosphoribosyltransferase
MTTKREKFSEPHLCPYCDAEIAEAAFPFCEACNKKAQVCPQCGAAVARSEQKCPHCGAGLKGEAAKEG